MNTKTTSVALKKKAATNKKKPAKQKNAASESNIEANSTDEGGIIAPFPGTPQRSELINLSTEENSRKRPLTILIPYLASAAIGDELKYALRAWEKNFKGDFEIVIVGDKPDFVSDEVVHLEALQIGANPQSDVHSKLMRAIASFFVSDQFIFTYDDVYPVSPISIDDLLVPRISGELGKTKLNAGSIYMERLLGTKKLLEDLGSPINDYETHLPVVFDKRYLGQLFADTKAEEAGLLVKSLYFNPLSKSNPTEPILTKGGPSGDYVVYIYRENPNTDVIKHGFEHRKFVNHNNAGYLPTLPFLQEAFPDKSKFEK